ncbi:hypothetical protein FRC17_000688 [Serendipita sp. 399]|nr:hypothetical protein FRC17_000688 [Serendipita sp. 399]
MHGNTTPNPSGSTTPAPVAGTTGGTAQHITPGADLSTYISTSLKGHGTKKLEDDVPAASRPHMRATRQAITAFDTEVNTYVKEEVEAEKKLAERVGNTFSIGTPELKFTDQIMKISLKHDVGFIAPCKDEKRTGGDLICSMHVEHVLPTGKVRKIFAVVQIKVAERYKKLGPTVDFTHTNTNGLQMELLAKEVIKKRGELEPDVDVLGAYVPLSMLVWETKEGKNIDIDASLITANNRYGATHEDRLIFMPLDDILEHYKGATVDPSAPFSRGVTTALFAKYGQAKGFLEEMVDYVEKRDPSPPNSPPSSPMQVDSQGSQQQHPHPVTGH